MPINFRDPKVIAVGAGGALGLVALARHRASSGTGATPNTAAGTLIPAATADTTANDVVNTLQPEIDALANALGQINTGAPAPPPPAPPTSPLTPMQKAVLAASPAQLRDWANLRDWSASHPGQDFTKGTWGMFHPKTPWSPAAQAAVVAGHPVP